MQKSHVQTEWAKFATVSKVTKIIRDEQPKQLYKLLQKTLFVEQRKWGYGKFFDGSKMTKGRQSLKNTLGVFLNSIFVMFYIIIWIVFLNTWHLFLLGLWGLFLREKDLILWYFSKLGGISTKVILPFLAKKRTCSVSWWK